jgi:hypothetical protein
MTTFLDVPFRYPATIIPKRARKERDVFLTAALTLPIPELNVDDAPVVIEAEVEYDYVVRTGEGNFNTAWRHKLVPVKYRRFRNHLFRPFDAVYQCGFEIPPTFSVTREEAPELFRKILKTMNRFLKFEVQPVIEPWRHDTFNEKEFEGKVLSEKRDERARHLTEWVSDLGLVLIDNLLWKRTELPVWDIGYEEIQPELSPTADKGSRRYLRPAPYENLSTTRIDEAFWNKDLAQANFARAMAEKQEYSRASRTALEITPERGHITVVGELPFGRNEAAQRVYECLSYVVELSRGIPDDLNRTLLELIAAADAIRRDESADPQRLIELLTEFNEPYSKLPENKYHNPVEYRLKKIQRMISKASPEASVTAPIKPFSHRARKANGYDTVPAQALIPIDRKGAIVFIGRQDARQAAVSLPAEVKTYTEVFQVDGLSAFRASGSVTLTEIPRVVGSAHSLEQILDNKQLDLLSKCDWETWRRGAGTVLRPEGTGGMVARMWVRRGYASTLYIFLDDRYTYEAIEDIDKVGDAKQLCEAALEAYGFGTDHFNNHFGDIFRLKRDRMQEPQPNETKGDGGEFDFDGTVVDYE